MKLKLLLMFIALFVVFSAPATYAQGVRTGPDPSTLRDPDLERDSPHNLEVARNYFKLKKAYVAALKRCEEIIAGNPNFARIEEVLAHGRPKQSLACRQGRANRVRICTSVSMVVKKRTLTSQQFREMGRDYLNKLIND